ncbi:aspartate kinase [Salibacterium halotolerans]|uniref:Aspartokinase n=1 Tax=Salibacterium halotolerans TaxID=1884432 RepID=A0A1I5MS37_9BACI|nr:aspartate kinase [Salibacterium halotolerans]SFP12384.1 aspartate kinase [Salibacterium halotolerans]
MEVLVQKFGGTSVQDEQTRSAAAAHVKRASESGSKVVVVVSAIGRKGSPYATDTLAGLIQNEHSPAPAREQDLLLSCGEVISAVVFSEQLRAAGVESMAFTGGQAGIRTNNAFGDAVIEDVQTSFLEEAFEHVDVVVVAGFQGMSGSGITTLGRGGSDTTAAALGAALQAEVVDIFTDVDGVMTADPGMVKEASLIPAVTYEEVSNLAVHGARVVHPRAVETAEQGGIPMRIRSTASEHPGTWISSQRAASGSGKRQVTGIAHKSGLTQVTVRSEDGISLQQTVFREMADARISVDFISIQPAAVMYTIPSERTQQVVQLLQQKGYEPECLKDCTKISAVGAAMTGTPGVAATMVDALAAHDIDIYQASDSHTTIWVLVSSKHEKQAVTVLHDAFCLNHPTTGL